jgi:hypothetical protein
MASPIPDPAPVTNATFPSNCFMSFYGLSAFLAAIIPVH